MKRSAALLLYVGVVCAAFAGVLAGFVALLALHSLVAWFQ